MQSYKLKLFLDSYCFYKYPQNTEETLHESCDYVTFVTAGVTYLKPSSKITRVQDSCRLDGKQQTVQQDRARPFLTIHNCLF
jgi:hypothetical protein